jgi:hypothetical protein
MQGFYFEFEAILFANLHIKPSPFTSLLGGLFIGKQNSFNLCQQKQKQKSHSKLL